jgi:caffeoyl-CoA O-methyltransferase
VAAELDDICAHAAVDDETAARLRRVRDIACGLDPYLAACTTPETEGLATLSRRTQAEHWVAPLEQEMLSGHLEGVVLKFFVHMARATRVLEIGMFTGYSALAMAEALPPEGTVVACEVDARAADIARRAFAASAHGHKIDVRVAPAGETLSELARTGDTFDLVFVDADKAGYISYVDTVLDRGLLAPGGVICVDNTLMQGQPYVTGGRTANGEAITAFNEWLAADERVEQVLIPLRDGLTLVRRVTAQ